MRKIRTAVLQALRRAENWVREALTPRSWAGWVAWASVIALVVLAFYVAGAEPSRLVTGIAFLVPEVLLATVLLRRLKLPWTTVLAFNVALVTYAIYFSYSNYNERNFDAKAQLEYITYMVQHGTAPPATHCFV